MNESVTVTLSREQYAALIGALDAGGMINLPVRSLLPDPDSAPAQVITPEAANCPSTLTGIARIGKYAALVLAIYYVGKLVT